MGCQIFIRLVFSLVWLVGFYGISTIVGYLMSNPFLNIKTVLFQAIQISKGTQFQYQISSISTNSVLYKYAIKIKNELYFKQISLAYVHSSIPN